MEVILKFKDGNEKTIKNIEKESVEGIPLLDILLRDLRRTEPASFVPQDNIQIRDLHSLEIIIED